MLAVDTQKLGVPPSHQAPTPPAAQLHPCPSACLPATAPLMLPMTLRKWPDLCVLAPTQPRCCLEGPALAAILTARLCEFSVSPRLWLGSAAYHSPPHTHIHPGPACTRKALVTPLTFCSKAEMYPTHGLGTFSSPQPSLASWSLGRLGIGGWCQSWLCPWPLSPAVSLRLGTCCPCSRPAAVCATVSSLGLAATSHPHSCLQPLLVSRCVRQGPLCGMGAVRAPPQERG